MTEPRVKLVTTGGIVIRGRLVSHDTDGYTIRVSAIIRPNGRWIRVNDDESLFTHDETLDVSVTI